MMALTLISSLAFPSSLYTPTRLSPRITLSQVKPIRHHVPHAIRCVDDSTTNVDQKIVRRSTNYQPPIWDYDYVQSLSSKYAGDLYAKQAAELKEDVKVLLTKVMDPLEGLEMIDDLQRLGVYYHFEDKIKKILESIYSNKDEKWNKEDLHATALKFRLLRQHGNDVPQEVFKNFKDERGDFKACLGEDIRGMICMYEASYLSVEGESILEEARDFATKNLQQNLKRKDIDQDLALLVSHALELPLHWRMPMLDARWFIDQYERRSNMNPTLLRLAKLDFNMVQATHQEDLKHMSRSSS